MDSSIDITLAEAGLFLAEAKRYLEAEKPVAEFLITPRGTLVKNPMGENRPIKKDTCAFSWEVGGSRASDGEIQRRYVKFPPDGMQVR